MLGIWNLGYKFWIVWAVVCFASILITYVLYPKTANRTPKDINRLFEIKPGILVHRNKLAVQLHRPAEFIKADVRIAKGEAGTFGDKRRRYTSTEYVETKEVV